MIVFDLDGTLRDVSGSHHLCPSDPTKSNHWIDWQHHANENGTPIDKTVKLFHSFTGDITVLTSSQFGTARWLYNHGLYLTDIIERQDGDHRNAFHYKADFIHAHLDEIVLWVDDDEMVLDYVEALGIPVCRIKACTSI